MKQIAFLKLPQTQFHVTQKEPLGRHNLGITRARVQVYACDLGSHEKQYADQGSSQGTRKTVKEVHGVKGDSLSCSQRVK
jgi:hypothetical protein